jgi:hypothetical protein
MLMRRGSGPVNLMERHKHGKPGVPTESELEFARYVLDELKDTHYSIAPHLLVLWIPYQETEYFGEMLEGIMERPTEYRDERIVLVGENKLRQTAKSLSVLMPSFMA